MNNLIAIVIPSMNLGYETRKVTTPKFKIFSF